MSVFNDFLQVWLQRFPENPLPGAWEDQVKINLAKHKQKVAMFKDEVRREEIYVEYLERLLHDIQKHKKNIEDVEQIKEEFLGDVIADNVSNDSAATGICTEEYETSPANRCVTEISNELSRFNEQTEESDNSLPDPFVTIIEVDGFNKTATATHPPVPPKIPVKPDVLRNNSFQRKLEHRDSVGSSDRVSTPDEPYYDLVASDIDFPTLESDNSSAENTLNSGSSFLKKQDKAPESPSASNYVNINFFLNPEDENGGSSSDEEVREIRHRCSNGSSYASTSSLELSTPSTKRKFPLVEHGNETEKENVRYKMILGNIISSETDYVEWLNVLIKYMKAIHATLSTSQRIITETELSTIFYKIPELYELHSKFLKHLKNHTEKMDKIGDCFKILALNLELYGAFLSNYGRALDTVRKCCESNVKFCDITKNITYKQLSKQPINLEDILHKPVARVQKNALVLHDLLKCIPKTHPDYSSLEEALQLTQSFLDQYNMIQTKSMFAVSDRAQRRLVKNSFIVESVDGHRKLRHLFLFNDVIACAKYKSSGRTEKFTFELKWFIPVEDIIILLDNNQTYNFNESSIPNIISLKSQASNVRDQLRQEEKSLEEKKLRSSRGSDKIKKRLGELESQLVLFFPNLLFRIKSRHTSRLYLFFLSSEFERTQWIETIQTLQKTGKPPTPSPNFSMLELQTWITACRTYLKTNMGSYLLRTVQDESLLVGDLHIHVFELTGIEYSCEAYVIFEVDFYGHFVQKAKTKAVFGTNSFNWNEKFIIDLEGSENLRILVYRCNPTGQLGDTCIGKHIQKLGSSWLSNEPIEKKYNIHGASLKLSLTFVPCVLSLRRLPTGKSGALFGEKIETVCRRQKRDIPYLITACIREVERRGMSEIGVYRVSGSVSDVSKLKKSFETNSYEAEQLLKEVDIHSVTGILKMYLRELPEALFTDERYPALSEAFNQSNGNLTRRIELLRESFAELPKLNQTNINIILEHLIRVHQHEDENKMSLHNLATVFGPTLVRPGMKLIQNKKDSLSAETVDVMTQAGILYCYLKDMNSNKNC